MGCSGALWRIFKEITHIHYFTGGSAAQYNNLKQNVCLFGIIRVTLECFQNGNERNCKAASSKRKPSKEIQDQILTPMDLYKFYEKNIKGLKLIFVFKKSNWSRKNWQRKILKRGYTVSGTTKLRHFKPVNKKQVRVSKILNDALLFITYLGKSAKSDFLYVSVSDIQPRQ